MTKEAIGTGLTVELALEDACEKIGLGRDQVEFEILEMPVKKTFGLFGGSPAKVRVFVNESVAQIAERYLRGIFTAMGISPRMEVEEREDALAFTIHGDDIGFLIGRRGETLDALQYLTGLVANRSHDQYCRVIINSGDYREKREKTLISLARRMAINAVRTGRNAALEPMNPYERRIIHTAVQEIDGASSWSVGEEPNRHVVIGSGRGAAASQPGGDKPYRASSGRPGDSGHRPRGGRPGRDQRDHRPRSGDRPRREAPQGPSQNEKPDVPLYGKINPKA